MIAAGVLLTLFVPGYLFQAGVREFTNVLKAERDVYAIAQAVAISAGMLLFVFVLLEVLSVDDVPEQLLHDPANKNNKGLTLAQVALLGILLAFSNLLGKGFGRLMRRRRKKRLEGSKTRTGAARVRHWASCPFRWIFGLFFGTSELDRRIDEVIREAREADTYVRVVRQGEEDLIGLVDKDAARASASPVGSGLALSARWTCNPGVGWQRLGGAHVAKPEIVEILSWNCQKKGLRPAWVEGVVPKGSVPRPRQGGGDG